MCANIKGNQKRKSKNEPEDNIYKKNAQVKSKVNMKKKNMRKISKQKQNAEKKKKRKKGIILKQQVNIEELNATKTRNFLKKCWKRFLG